MADAGKTTARDCVRTFEYHGLGYQPSGLLYQSREPCEHTISHTNQKTRYREQDDPGTELNSFPSSLPTSQPPLSVLSVLGKHVWKRRGKKKERKKDQVTRHALVVVAQIFLEQMVPLGCHLSEMALQIAGHL